MTRQLIVFLFLGISGPSFSQISLGYFPWNYSQVQLSSSPSNLIFADARVETNTFISNLNVELAAFVNLQRREEYSLYLGPGLVSYPLFGEDEEIITGYFFTVGVRWMPFPKLRQLGIIFEISPYVHETLEGARLRSNLGLSYSFGS